MDIFTFLISIPCFLLLPAEQRVTILTIKWVHRKSENKTTQIRTALNATLNAEVIVGVVRCSIDCFHAVYAESFIHIMFIASEVSCWISFKPEFKIKVLCNRCECPSYHCTDMHAAAVSQHVSAGLSNTVLLQQTNHSALAGQTNIFSRMDGMAVWFFEVYSLNIKVAFTVLRSMQILTSSCSSIYKLTHNLCAGWQSTTSQTCAVPDKLFVMIVFSELLCLSGWSQEVECSLNLIYGRENARFMLFCISYSFDVFIPSSSLCFFLVLKLSDFPIP